MRSLVQVYASSLFSKIVFALAGLLLIRLMPVGEFAAYTLALSVVLLVAQPVIDLANRLYIIYAEIGSMAERLTVVVALQSVVVAIAGTLVVLMAPVPAELTSQTVLAIAATIAFESVKTFYQANQDFRSFWRLESARAGLYAVAIAAVAIWNGTLTAAGALGLLIVAALLSAVLPGWLALRAANWRLLRIYWIATIERFSTISTVRRVVDRMDLAVYVLAQSVIGQVSVFTLNALSNQQQLAAFGSASRYYGLIILALASLQTVLLPAMQTLSTNDEVSGLLRAHRRLSLYFSAAVALAAVSAIWAIPLIDAGRYPEALATFWVLCASAIVSFTFGVFPILALNMRLFRLLCWTSLLALGLCCLSNGLLIGPLGAVGAALATLITHAFFNVAVAILTSRRRRKPQDR